FKCIQKNDAGQILTKDDVASFLKVGQVMEKDLVVLRENDKISKVFDYFSTYDFLIYPVVNKENRLLGVVRLENLRAILKEQHCWDLILARDIVFPLEKKVFESMTLKQALEKMADLKMQQIPVVERNYLKPVGIIDSGKIDKVIEEKLILMEVGLPVGG
ncbi:MAG: CBS domain-containing protein, partial [Candidatus Zixiibacteriota bacterium]